MHRGRAAIGRKQRLAVRQADLDVANVDGIAILPADDLKCRVGGIGLRLRNRGVKSVERHLALEVVIVVTVAAKLLKGLRLERRRHRRRVVRREYRCRT